MRANDPGWETTRNGVNGTWRVGGAVEGGWVKQPGSWGTPFSAFRFAVPELCGFEGRAIYLDADMLVLGDIAELWDMPPSFGRGMRCVSGMRSDVSVIDCRVFDRPDWPKIQVMKPSGARVFEYMRWMNEHSVIQDDLPAVWNDCDGAIYNREPESVKLLHYTNVLIGQPYRPYPNVTYPQTWPYCISSPAAGKLWWKTYQEALVERDGEESARRTIVTSGGVWQ